MPNDLYFDLSPTQLEFVTSDAHIVHLLGPMGEGKTFAGVAGLIAHAQRCGKNIRCALVRDTFQNIKTSTIPDIRDYLGSWVQFSDGSKKMVIKSNPQVECDLFGIDDEASISKLQGPQYACIWLEEPAPIFEKANAGLPREVFNLSLARAARQSGTIVRVQITQNPADEEHWTSLLADEPDEYMTVQDEATGEWITIQKRTFWIPRGENKHLSTLTRAAQMAAFKNDPAKWQRYIEGETATIQLGKKVTPGYGKIHFSDRILPVFPSETFQFWDGWHHPSCIIAQYNPFGQLVFHDCFSDDEKTATKELMEQEIEPLLSTPKYKDKIPSWRIIGDSTMRTADQSSIRSSAAGYLEKTFKSHFEPAPVHWRNLREPLNQCFHRLVNEGRPAVVNSRSAVKLHRALKGGWHYKTDNSGHVIGDKPVPDEYSHLGMAFAYGISILLPYDPRKKLKKVSKRIRQKRAMSYRGGNFSRNNRVVNPVPPGLM